ncbi:MAG: di-heme oxidoredictase family protein, partial [Candidatus Paceibacterota bacterium]
MFIFTCILGTSIANAQDLSAIGGDLTSDFIGKNAIQLKAPNVISQERWNLQASGFGVFHGVFIKKTGLGPNFINSSCGGCHLNNGRGPIGSFERDKRTTMVIKVSRPRLNADGSPRNIPGVGDQLLNHSLGKIENVINIRLRWILVNGTYPDGTTYQLRKPKLKIFIRGELPRRIVYSLRMSPPLIGMGLLEAISDATLLNLSDPFDLNNDGISGKLNYVPDVRKGLKTIGRFGFKATQTTVEQQSAAALFSDMRISNSLFPSRRSEVEISDDALFRLAIYQRIGGIPRARNQNESYCTTLLNACETGGSSEAVCLAQEQ